MAEAVGLVAASGQFIEQSIKIIKLSKALYDKVQGAPSELQSWRQKLEELRGLVRKIKQSPALPNADIEAAIVRCKDLCNNLNTIFDKLDFKETDPIGRKTWKAIGGLAKEQEIRDLFQQIEKVKSSLTVHMGVVAV